MVIGERLRQIREAKQMSQGDVERKTGLLRCYVSRCENGHTVPSIDTLEKWANALEVSLSQLFADSGETIKIIPVKHNSPKLNRTATNHLRRVSAAFARMQPKDMVIVTSLARKFR